MRSLALKLTLAFLIIGLTVAGLVAFFIGRQTQRQFDQFVQDRSRIDVVAALADYYESNGGWQNVQEALISRRAQADPRYRRDWMQIVVADDRGIVAAGTPQHPPGSSLSGNEQGRALPVRSDGRVVGYVLLPFPGARGAAPPDSPELAFINAVQRAIVFSVLGAFAIALLLGVLLARTISRPVQELTQATQRVAEGDLGHEVPVRTQDELGALAASFNQMSARLAQANRLRRQMTADIAHDLRTPTSVIMGYTEALSDGKLPGSLQMYQVLHKEAQHLNHLIEDLRTLSLADAGELPLQRRPVSPLEMLQNTAVAHAIQAQKQNVSLHVAAPHELPPVLVDPDRMAQVLNNLVSNALRFTPPGGRITLAAESGAQVRLRVQDTGSGISAAELPFIFRRFYRGDEARPQSGESGLGLAIARSIVEAHGGTISVESVAGAGTTFTIDLPAAASVSPL